MRKLQWKIRDGNEIKFPCGGGPSVQTKTALVGFEATYERRLTTTSCPTPP